MKTDPNNPSRKVPDWDNLFSSTGIMIQRNTPVLDHKKASKQTNDTQDSRNQVELAERG